MFIWIKLGKVIELAWQIFFVNYLTGGNDNLRKVVKRENGGLRSVGVIEGYELRAAGYEVLSAGHGVIVVPVSGLALVML